VKRMIGPRTPTFLAVSSLGLAALASCSALVQPAALDANGCRPAMAIYQPPVTRGGSGSIINIPAQCPPSLVLAGPARSSPSSTAAQTSGTVVPPVSRIPPPERAVGDLIHAGIVDFCGWFFGDTPYSLPGLQAAAFDAGYARGSGSAIVPLPEMLREMSFSSLGFEGVIADRASDGHGVSAHVTFHNPVCQIQSYGYGEDIDAVIIRLRAAGWRTVGEPTEREADRVERLYGTIGTRPVTLVVHRRLTTSEEPALDSVINVLPGHQTEFGVLS